MDLIKERLDNLKLKQLLQAHMVELILIFSFLYKSLVFDKQIYSEFEKKSTIITFLMIFAFYYFAHMFLKRKHTVILFLLNCFISIIYLANAVFYREYGDFITIALVKQISQVSEVKGSIYALLRPSDLLYLIDLPVLYFINAKYNVTSKIKLWSTAAKFSILYSIAIFSLIITDHIVPGIVTQQFSRDLQVKQVGLLAMYNVQGYNFVKNNINIKPISADEAQQIDGQLKTTIAPFDENYTGKNLIVIQVESLQGFFVNAKYNGKEITPNINKLVNESAYFNNCYQQIGIGHTADAELLTNTSMYPAEDSCAYFDKYNNSYISIAKDMKSLDYSTLYFHGNKGAFWNRNLIYKNLGFDKFYSLESFKADELVWGLSDMSFFRQSFDVLKDEKQPFYGFFVTLTSHSPFEVNLNNFTSKETYMDNYINSINYADKAIGSFIDKLKSSGILDNSVVIVYGDHAGIDDKNLSQFLGKPIDKEYQSQNYKKIPMIVRFPEGKHAGIYTKSVGQNDVMATVKSLYNIQDNWNFGNSLFSEGDNLVVLRDGGYVKGNLFYCSKDNTTYDLTTGAVVKNDESLITKTKEQLKASDNIFKYNYFKSDPSIVETIAK